MTVYGEGLDPKKNPSPYGALSEPSPSVVKRLLARSAVIHSALKTDWEPRPLLIAAVGAKAADEQTGAMVALYPTAEEAQVLALTVADAEVPAELHITLAFLGNAADIVDQDRLREAVARFAATQPPVTGKISGTGRFVGAEAGKDAVYWSYDAPSLPALRQGLVEVLEFADAPANTLHGFTPHMTVGYGISMPDKVPTISLAFPSLSLVLGGRRWDYPLNGTVSSGLE